MDFHVWITATDFSYSEEPSEGQDYVAARPVLPAGLGVLIEHACHKTGDAECNFCLDHAPGKDPAGMGAQD